jgi:hypothetical protein
MGRLGVDILWQELGNWETSIMQVCMHILHGYTGDRMRRSGELLSPFVCTFKYKQTCAQQSATEVYSDLRATDQ